MRPRRIDFGPACLWFVISSACVLVLAAGVLVLDWPHASSFLSEKFDSLHYRILAYLPQPEHTEFVPTPLPTARVALEPETTPTPSPTEAPTETATAIATAQSTETLSPSQTSTPSVSLNPVRPSVQLTGITHDYQRWNNCGPTTLEMYLSYFGRHDTQAQIAASVKPNPDDKNVRPDELAAYVRTTGLHLLVRVNGTVDLIKLALSNGLPIVVETGFDPPAAHQGWMGHYRLVTGYDDKQFNTMDSYDGPNRHVDIASLDNDWRAFNRTYLVLYTDAQAPLVRALIGNDMDDGKMYTAAVARANQELALNPKDAFSAFNLGSSLLGLKRYDEAAAAFDRARLAGLPWRMLWYQFGPYQAYIAVGRYNEVISLADATLKVDAGLEESHYYKGMALEKLGRPTDARSEFTLALKYNHNYVDAQQALAQL